MPSSFSRILRIRVATHIAAVCLAIGAIVSVSEAQTRFEWPESTSKFDNYETVEECIAAITRIRTKLVMNRAIWRDTVQPALQNKPELSTQLIQAAERCSRSFDSLEPPLTSWRLYAEMYLSAQRETDARAVFDRRIAQIEAERQRDNANLRNDSVYSAVIDTMMDAYISRRPDRVFSDTRFLERWVAADAVPYADRSERLEAMFNIAKLSDDSVQMQWAAEQIVQVASRISDDEKNTRYFASSFAPRHHRALEYLTFALLADSLRKGTTSWIALKRDNWQQVDSRHTTPMNPALGSQAPVLTGESWFDSTGPIAPKDWPVPGRPALVIFLSQECRGRPTLPPELKPIYCWESFAVLRRIAERYPTLDITTVVQGLGYFWPKGPMPSANEAEYSRQWLLGFHHLPGTLVFSSPTSWFLPKPDGRRILDPEPNGEAYGFGRSNRTPATGAFLFDSDGILVESESLGLGNERKWESLVDILLTRQK